MIAGVLFDYQPFGFLDADGAITGFDVELVRAIAAEWGAEVQFVPVTPSTRLQSLVAGQVDLVAAAMPHTHAAEQLIDFSQTYFSDTPALLVNSSAQTVDLASLAGKTIAAVQEDPAILQLQAALAKSGDRASILPFQEYAPALAALRAGQADALLAQSSHLVQVARENLEFSVIVNLAESQPLGLGVAQGDTHFRHLVDSTLEKLQQRGDYAALHAKWFPDLPLTPLTIMPGESPYTFDITTTLQTAPVASQLTAIAQRGKVLVGVRYDLAPFGFVNDQGEITGFDVDIAHELARRWMGDPDAVELVQVTPETAIPLLNAGQVDLLIAALPETWANAALVDFSITYFEDGLSILTRADRQLQQLEDLAGQTVAFTAGAESSAINVAGGDIRSQLQALPLREYRSAQQALLANQIDALIGSSTVLITAVESNPALKIAVSNFQTLPYAIGLPLFDFALRDRLNLTLQAMVMDGAYAALYKKWFGEATPPVLELWPGVDEAQDAIAVQTEATVTLSTSTPLPPVSTRTLVALTSSPTPVATAPATITLAVTPVVVARLVLVPTSTSSPTPAPRQWLLVPTVTTVRTANVTATVAATPTNTIATATPVSASPTVATPTREPTAFATPAPTITASLPPTVTIRLGISVNARSVPAITASVMTILSGGTNWPALAISEDGQWVQLALPGGRSGWVSAIYLVEAVQFAAPAPTATPIPPTPTAAPTVAVTPLATHIVSGSDTLATIAQQYYGDQTLWQLIYTANQERIGADPNILPLGAELIIPPAP
ncbi:MAG: transporter substrate-binding domain-containing protein [Caldilineaceae bacterium]